MREIVLANLQGSEMGAQGAGYADVTDVTPLEGVDRLDRESDFHNLSEEDAVSEYGSLEAMEARLMEQTLHDTGGNRRLTAERLGIGERTLYRKLKKIWFELDQSILGSISL